MVCRRMSIWLCRSRLGIRCLLVLLLCIHTCSVPLFQIRLSVGRLCGPDIPDSTNFFANCNDWGRPAPGGRLTLPCLAVTCLAIPYRACLALSRHSEPCLGNPRHACLALPRPNLTDHDLPRSALPASPRQNAPVRASSRLALPSLPVPAPPHLALPCRALTLLAVTRLALPFLPCLI